MQWKKAPRDVLICHVPPDARLTLKIFPKGDGRWTWQVFAGTAENAMATGIAASLGAAKNVVENFANRTG